MTAEQNVGTSAQKRRIRLKDGRYMIFYTFEDLPASLFEDTQSKRPESEPGPQAEDERDV